MNLKRRSAARAYATAESPATATDHQAGVTPVAGKRYTGGFTAAGAQATGHSAGEHNLHRRSVHGKANARRAMGRFPRMVSAAFATEISIIGTTLRQSVQTCREQLAHLSGRVGEARQLAIDAIEESAWEARRLAQREHEIERQGLYLPHRVFLVVLMVALAGLFGADFTMLPVSFSPLNLSDARLLGVPGLDELHLAATGVLTGLVVLAHRAAAEARTILHERWLERHTPQAGRDALPDRDTDAGKLLGLWLVFGLLLLAGVTLLRVTYLSTIGVSAEVVEFLLINLGIYGASFSASLWFAHPLVREYRSSRRRAQAAKRKMGGAVSAFRGLVAEHNVWVERIALAEANAVQHVGAAASTARLTEDTYELGLLFGQLEPTDERLFEDDPDLPEVPGDVMARLRGVALPGEYAMLDPAELDPLIVERRDEVLLLRRKLERLPIDLIGAIDVHALPDPAAGAPPERKPADEVGRAVRSERVAPDASHEEGNGHGKPIS